MIANLHDLLMTVGFLAVLGVEFDLTTIAALLTILGYSINDTVVVFDRIREMLRRYKKMPIEDLINISINATLSRSIITHVTVSLALLSLLFFGGPTLYSFSAAMTFGAILVGTYTTIFIAAPLLIYLHVGSSRFALEGDAGSEAWRANGPELGGRPGRAAFSLPRADRRLRQRRLPLRRHVASRIAPASAAGHLGMAVRPRPARSTMPRSRPCSPPRTRSNCFSSGPGAESWLLPAPLRARFRAARIVAEVMTTGAAVRTYNLLLGERRRVAAGLIAVD